MDFTIIDRAGVTQEEFAEIAGVSRITVNTWAKGHHAPSAASRLRVSPLLAALQAAITAGALPVPVMDRRAAVTQVLTAIRESLPAQAA